MTQTVLLGDICDIKIGRTPPRKEEKWFSPKNGNKWVSIKDMGVADKNIYNTSEYLIDEAVKKFRIPVIKSGTLMLSFKLTVGRLCFATEDMYSNEAIAQLPIMDSNLVDKNWLYYYLKNFNFNSLSSTSSIATAVNSQSIKNIKIELPDVETQKKIVDILSSLDEKIELNRKMNETLEQMGQALFHHYFIDNPEAERWKDVPISDANILEIIKPKIEKFGGDKSYIATANVSNNNIVGVLENISYKKRPSRANMQPISGSVWFSKMVGEHKALIIDDSDKDIIEKSILSTGFLGLKPKEKYLYYIWSYINSDIFACNKDSLATGAVMIALNNGSFSKINVKIPTDVILNDFNLRVADIYKRISLNNREINNLITLREILLPRLINGRIKL